MTGVTLIVWIYSLVSIFIISVISLIGVFTVSMRMDKIQKILFFLVSFSAGTLFGGAFFHLLPEASEKSGFTRQVSLFVILGILTFFILEKFIHWRHCHVPTSKSHPHPLAYTNLVGDALHNFIDGLLIAGSFMVSINVGIATTLAVLFHEIPQEIGDFGVLVYAGFSRLKALVFNFLVALTAVAGGIVSLLLGSRVENYGLFLLPFTAGGFLYIAGSDLIPELHKECNNWKSILQMFGLVLGIFVMFLLLFVKF